MSFHIYQSLGIIPYPFIKGTLNNPILGGKYVKNIKQKNNKTREIIALELLQARLESITLYEIYSPVITAI